MAAVPVNLSGIATLPDGSSGNFAFTGLASIAGLGVGGGPVTPPDGPVDPGYSPPWARPPVDPGYSPPWAQVPVDPPTDTIPAPPSLVLKPPPDAGGWGWVAPYGWGFFPGPGAGPKK